ncbi:Protein Line, C-terminal [Sesbania bispinosa]|nr:Protein Line, C-terminal [Sesbania bispinosa]
MSPAGELWWLCRLVDESLRSYTSCFNEPRAFVSMSKEKEKEILIASSQVVRKIQLRIHEFDSAPSKDGLSSSKQHSSDHQCLPKIVTEMMILLTVKSEFVQHVAVNALVLTSQFVSTTGNNWDEFIHLLCCSLEMAFARMLLCSSEKCNFNSPDVNVLMQYGLRNCDWSTVAGITRVLRVICKHLKVDYDDGLVKVYYDLVNSCLLKMPWDFLDEYWSGGIGSMKKGSSMNQLNLNNFSAMEPGIKFIGTFLQLLCSLVDQNEVVETRCNSVYKHPLFVTVSNLIPRLVKWCLSKQEDSTGTHIVHYLKHKLLILMIRLGSLSCLDCLIHFSWFELLHNYFQELLQQPLTQFQSDQGDCLEGSPFLLSLSDEEACGMHSSHLQRQAVFLLLACSFSMISQRGLNVDHCNCSALCSCFTSNPDSKLDFSRKKGSLELYKWIQGHLPTEISINHEKYLEICTNFMSSFLQLYLCEDDLLFEVLLQLLSISSCLQQQSERKDAAYVDVKKDFPFDLSDIFNPVHLFHLFLSEIHYDHQVLLDYLISKDTGISCAKYLLRCMHLICNSWKLFVKFPLFGEFSNQSSCKRRKVLGDGQQFLADGMPSSFDKNGSIILNIKNYTEDSEYGFKHYNIKPFKKATECLLSLSNSIENLHQKNLFPYNPEALLKRFVVLYLYMPPPFHASCSKSPHFSIVLSIMPLSPSQPTAIIVVRPTLIRNRTTTPPIAKQIVLNINKGGNVVGGIFNVENGNKGGGPLLKAHLNLKLISAHPFDVAEGGFYKMCTTGRNQCTTSGTQFLKPTIESTLVAGRDEVIRRLEARLRELEQRNLGPSQVHQPQIPPAVAQLDE